MIHYRHGFVVRAAAEDGTDGAEDGPLRIVAATEGKKGDGLDLRMDRADLKRFTANPVIGYAHDFFGRANLPIGKASRVQVDGKALLMDVAFDMGDPFAAEVDRKYRSGFLNAFSIGFDASNVDEQGVPESWELFETSSVPLPMDPAALVESGRARHAAALAALLGEARAGKVLSAKNKGLVKDAIAALQALLDAAGADDENQDDDEGDEGDDEGRGAPRAAAAPRLTAARRRLHLVDHR